MKLILFGKSGMLGFKFHVKLQNLEGIELKAFDRSELDVTDYEKVAQYIEDFKPNFLVNCVAYTNVDGAESEQKLAFKVNAEAVGIMAKACKKVGTTFLHFSTDYVFDGKNSKGYEENHERNPLNIYGKSKANGEELIQANLEKYYIVRTSWLYGENGKNFVTTMLKLAETKNELEIVNDQTGSPTYTGDLCEAVVENFIKQSPEFGIYHLTNDGHCTWLEFAAWIFRKSGIKIKLNPITTEKFNRPALRPKCSILINSKLPRLRLWNEALSDFLLPKAGS